MIEQVQELKTLIADHCQKLARPINIMEVCGTHTVSIFRNGIRSILPKNLRLISGPGCPVCVTPQSYIDTMINLAKNNDCIIATYGDMIRVPGESISLEKLNQSNIKIVLSSFEAVELAKNNPDKTIVFIAIGFETTTPATAAAVEIAIKESINNFTILCGHKLVLPAMRALLSGTNNNIDGFLCPGHVSVITGYKFFEPIANEFKKPCVVAGFEPLQILQGIERICRQLTDNVSFVESMYPSVVTENGNLKAQRLTDKYFSAADGFWRGIGNIPDSTMKLKEAYSNFDVLSRYSTKIAAKEKPTGCQCGQVLCGLIDPPQCKLFGEKCRPQNPVGPCMVSSEGSCAAWYKYNRKVKS